VVVTCGKCGHEISVDPKKFAAAMGAKGGLAKVKKGFAVTGQPKVRHKDRECVV